ncbi:unnamed protein product, partial [Prorocentrum cordatum]
SLPPRLSLSLPTRGRIAHSVQVGLLSSTVCSRGILQPDDVVGYLNGELGSRICFLDGGVRARIEAEGLDEAAYRGDRFQHFRAKDAAGRAVELAGNYGLLALTQPGLVQEMHKEYFLAGADICRTITLGCTREGQAGYRMQHMVYEMNRRAAEIAKRAAAEATQLQPARPRLVAGTLGPLGGGWTDMYKAYEEAVRGLMDGGADLLFVDQAASALGAKAAVAAADACALRLKRQRLPVIVCASTGDGGALPSGGSLAAFAVALRHARPLALGAAGAPGHLEALPDVARGWCAAVLGSAAMAADASALAARGLLNFVGGGADTSAADLAALVGALRTAPPRKPQAPAESSLQLSGLTGGPTPCDADFRVIGQQCASMGSAKFKALVDTLKTSLSGALSGASFGSAVDLCAQQADRGADIIDVNLDADVEDPSLAAKGALMAKFVSACSSHPSLRGLPLSITSSNLEVILAGLQSAPGKCIANGLSLLSGEEKFVLAARECQRHGAAVVVFSIDEGGLPESREGRVRACQRSYHLLRSRLGFPAEDIIFDCCLGATTALDIGKASADFISAVGEVKSTCPGVSCVAGLGNLSLPFRGLSMIRDAIHAVFLRQAIPRGVNLAFAEPGCLPRCADIDPEVRTLCEEVVLNRSADGKHAERLLAYVNVHSGTTVRLALTSSSPPASAGLLPRAPSQPAAALLARRGRSTPAEQKAHLLSLCPQAARSTGRVARAPRGSCWLVGQRCNAGGSATLRVLAEACQATSGARKWEPVLELCAQQLERGADALDLNFDGCPLEGPAAMGEFVRLCVQDPRLASAPLVISSGSWPVIEEGLKHAQGKGIANALSLASGEQEFLQMASTCKRYGAAVVVLPVERQERAASPEDRVRACRRSFALLRERLGFPAEDIIFDCGLLPLRDAEDASQIRGCLDAMEELRTACPAVSFVAGVGNLSLPFRGVGMLRDALHSVFLHHAVPRGLNMAIVDAGRLPRHGDIEAPTLQLCEEAVLGQRAPARLFALAESLAPPAPEQQPAAGTEAAARAEEQHGAEEGACARPAQPCGRVARRFRPGTAVTDLVQATGTLDGSIFGLFGSKAHAALRLHSYAHGSRLNRVVYFSSISVWMGQGGSGPTVGASAILDGLALWQRQQQLGTSASTVLWGAIGQIGLRLAVYGDRDVMPPRRHRRG